VMYCAAATVLSANEANVVETVCADDLDALSSGVFIRDPVPQRYFERQRIHRIRLLWSDAARGLADKLDLIGNDLDKHVKFYSGLIARAGQSSIIIPSKPLDYSADKYGRLIPSGSQLARYSLKYEGHYCRKRSSLYKSGFTPEYYEDAKLFLNQTGDHLKVRFDDCRYYCLNNMHVGYPVSGQVDLKYVNAVLCSRLIDWYYKAISLEQGRAGAQTDIDVLDELPIRTIDLRPPVRARDASLKNEYDEWLDTNYFDGVLSLARASLATHAALYGPAGKPELKDDPYWKEQIAHADVNFPGREDFVHDLLAMLAQRMMDLNKEKHDAIERFETDLRGQADAEVHERLEKGKQGRTLYKHESCQPYVEEGSGSTHHLHEALAWSEEAFEDLVRELAGRVPNLSDLVGVYRNYSEAYRRVTEALEKTDDLIDQIVYALYGLSAEEIAIVEESLT